MVPKNLPFKITAQPKSVQKAYSRFLEQYGYNEGTRIFLQKADEKGTGKTLRQKVLSVYTEGSKVKRG